MSDETLLEQFTLSSAAVGYAADCETTAIGMVINERHLLFPGTHKISSGEKPTVGLRVFTNDWRWGTITKVASGSKCGTYCEAWHSVQLDGESGSRTYNCDRLTTREPR
jgi:hypothetical protein